MDKLCDDRVPITAMKRIAKPLEIAKVLAFIVSQDNMYMTGSAVKVDGGLALGYQTPRPVNKGS
jgi:NAD(P)-dependent dehydrogenase (short-subunit alcohol dehydrogenase family)